MSRRYSVKSTFSDINCDSLEDLVKKLRADKRDLKSKLKRLLEQFEKINKPKNLSETEDLIKQLTEKITFNNLDYVEKLNKQREEYEKNNEDKDMLIKNLQQKFAEESEKKEEKIKEYYEQKERKKEEIIIKKFESEKHHYEKQIAFLKEENEKREKKIQEILNTNYEKEELVKKISTLETYVETYVKREAYIKNSLEKHFQYNYNILNEKYLESLNNIEKLKKDFENYRKEIDSVKTGHEISDYRKLLQKLAEKNELVSRKFKVLNIFEKKLFEHENFLHLKSTFSNIKSCLKDLEKELNYISKKED